MPAGGRWPGLVSGLILILSACSLEAPVENRPDATALLDRELVDVRTGEPFTLRELAEEQPVLLETMAVWCVTCLRQQREVVLAHQEADFHSVGIGIDPNEKAEDLARYADGHGFDWRFVTANGGTDISLTLAFEVTLSPFGVVFAKVFEELAAAQMTAFVARATSIYGGGS